MACNIFSRLFRRRDRQLPVSADRPSPPALPAHTDKLQLEQSLQQLDLLDSQEHHCLYLLDCLSEQGSYTLILPNIPFGIHNIYIKCVQDLPGFIGLESGISETPSTGIDVFIHFSTAADAAQAMASQPPILLGNGSSRRLEYDNRSTDTPERASKRQKTEPSEPLPKCLTCCEELDGPHSRPCLCCDARWCYPCLRTNFSTVLNDQERFPAKCCGRIVHFDVGRGVLAAADYDKYKTRFEESNTTAPVYCGNPACSEFLPARLAKPDDKGRVRCFSCQNVTCVECRVVVYSEDAETHKCTQADELTALMTQFDYKRCPRCNTGVAKMYGCSHVRCQCGAHWCWDCQRAIQLCWSKPCEGAQENGEIADAFYNPAAESDSEDEFVSETASNNHVQQPPVTEVTSTEVSNPDITQPRESPIGNESEIAQHPVIPAEQVETEEEHVRKDESQPQQTDQLLAPADDQAVIRQPLEIPIPVDAHVATVAVEDNSAILPRPPPLEYRPPAALATTPLSPVAQVSEITEPLINLDADDQDDWEASDFDFGDEPNDESWDTWGCMHHFELLKSSKMHQHWLPVTQDPQSLRPIKHIDCLRCFRTITITEPLVESQKEDGKKEDEKKDSGVDITPKTPSIWDIDIVEEPMIEVKKKRKNKKQGNIPKLFDCRRCGVIYCVACKKTTLKELTTQQKL